MISLDSSLIIFLKNPSSVYLKTDLKIAVKTICNNIQYTKVVMQGKLIAVVYTLRTYWNHGSLWAEFVNKNRCISVRLVSEEVQSIKFW